MHSGESGDDRKRRIIESSLSGCARGTVEDILVEYPEAVNPAQNELRRYGTGALQPWDEDQRATALLQQEIRERDRQHRHRLKKDWVPWGAGTLLIIIFGAIGIITKDKEVKPWALAVAGTVIAAGAQLVGSGHIAKEAAKEAIEKQNKQ